MLNNQNLTGLMESLTPDQKTTMKKRGYLTPKDLNAKQLKMLGDMKEQVRSEGKQRQGLDDNQVRIAESN